jgi:Tol biopolymer transport system component
MKQATIALFLSLLFLVGCTVEEALPTTAPVAQAPTTTSIPQPSATDTPVSTSTPTVTPTPPFPTFTPESTQRPTSAPATPDPSLPIPPGEIYFFLDPAPPADSQSLDQQPPSSYNFYRAVPGVAANEWYIETILTDMNLEGPSITVSPDQTKLALLLLDDTDGDGKLVHNRGGDIRNIYIYDLSEHSIERLTNNERSTLSVSWLPDSQGVTYPQSNEVLTTYLSDAIPRLVLDLPDGHVGQLVWSSDGEKLILFAYAQLTGLRVFEINLESISLAYETSTGNALLRWWSPDGQWLAFTVYGAQVYDNWRYIAVMNSESFEIIQLVFGDDFMSSPPDWSLDSQWLAFTKNESILSLWSTKSLTVTDVLSGTNMSIPAWSPIENRLAVCLIENGIAKVLVLDYPANTVTEIFQSNETYDVFRLFDWSPDGEWLLVFAANEEQSGLYVIHATSGTSYLVMDTMGSAAPRELVWLPDF